MKLLTLDRAISRRRLLRMNIVLGLAVFFVAFVVNVTGSYSNLSELKSADTLFNIIGLGGALYAAFSLIFCVMTKPFWFPEAGSKD